MAFNVYQTRGVMTFFLGMTLFGLLGAFYVTVGYTLILFWIAHIGRLFGVAPDPVRWDPAVDYDLPGISIAIPTFNEGERIRTRITNLLQTNYPLNKMEIYVVSDGSKDDTCDQVRAMIEAHPDIVICLEEFPTNQGKNAVQNHIAQTARYDIIVFTDTETRFRPDTLRALLTPFLDPAIGVCGGQVVYENIASTGNSTSTLYQTYRKLEDATRTLETKLGVGCKVDGPCAAGRRGHWRVLHAHEAEDQVLPLMAHQAHLKTVHVAQAIAHDVANSRPKQEFVQRRRMTRKALLSFKSCWSLSAAKTYPGFTAAYVSHKILRYFLPVFLTILLIGLLGIAAQIGAFWPSLLGIIGTVLISMALSKQPVYGNYVGFPYAFFNSNLALLLGIWDAFRGHSVGTYVPTHTIGKSN